MWKHVVAQEMYVGVAIYVIKQMHHLHLEFDTTDEITMVPAEYMYICVLIYV